MGAVAGDGACDAVPGRRRSHATLEPVLLVLRAGARRPHGHRKPADSRNSGPIPARTCVQQPQSPPLIQKQAPLGVSRLISPPSRLQATGRNG